MIVIDESSLAKYIVKEEGWTEVKKYLIGEEVHSVDLIVKEVLNVKGISNGCSHREVYHTEGTCR